MKPVLYIVYFHPPYDNTSTLLITTEIYQRKQKTEMSTQDAVVEIGHDSNTVYCILYVLTTYTYPLLASPTSLAEVDVVSSINSPHITIVTDGDLLESSTDPVPLGTQSPVAVYTQTHVYVMMGIDTDKVLAAIALITRITDFGSIQK